MSVQTDFIRGKAGLTGILEGISRARIGLIGDLCLDMYMDVDMRLSELSREVPNYTLPVVGERVSPGGAGNVAANLAALKPKALRVLGVLGRDWRGGLLKEALKARGVPTDELIVSPRATTNAYIKPVRRGYSDLLYESPRLDYENREALSGGDEAALMEALERAAREVDVLCVCDQLKNGCVTGRVRRRVCELARDGLRVIVDSRDRIGEYRDVIVKPNEMEAMRALNLNGAVTPERMAQAALNLNGAVTLERMVQAALALSERSGRPALITLGENGCLAAEDGRVAHIPARRVSGPTDICGAGDSFLAALACALGGGADIRAAAALGNLGASVTIAKLGETGTASRAELMRAFEDCCGGI